MGIHDTCEKYSGWGSPYRVPIINKQNLKNLDFTNLTFLMIHIGPLWLFSLKMYYKGILLGMPLYNLGYKEPV